MFNIFLIKNICFSTLSGILLLLNSCSSIKDSTSPIPKTTATKQTKKPIPSVTHNAVAPRFIVNVGDGKTGLTINGKIIKYASGTVIVVKPGTYHRSIILQNLTGVTVQGDGVILDGINQTKSGYYNCLNLSNLKNVTISGFTTRNNGYRMVNIDSRLVGVTLDKCTFINCLQGIAPSTTTNTVWDGTDNTVALLNFSITNSTITNCGGSGLGGNIANGQVTNLVKNFTFSGNTVTGGDPGDVIYCGAVDGFNIFNNTLDGINLNLTNDNRLFQMVGNGNVYNNKCTNYQGHFMAFWSVSFGSTVKTSQAHDNTCIGSRRYSAFEFQEFAGFAISGVTTHADLVVNNNTCGNLNTDHWTEFAANFIDNYQYGLMGGKVTLTNNKGYNFFPAPKPNIHWNLAQPAVARGNTYTAKP